MQSSTQEQLDRLLSLAADGRLTAGDFEQLNALLRDDAEARRVYLDYITLHGQLQWDHLAVQVTPEGEHSAGSSPQARQERERKMARQAASLARLFELAEESRKQPRTLRIFRRPEKARGETATGPGVRINTGVAALGTMAALIAIVVTAAFWAQSRTNEPTPVAAVPTPPNAVLADSLDAVWTMDGQPITIAAGLELPAGKLRLAEGLARVTFASGAEVVLEAPALFEVMSGNQAYLTEGSLTANVPLQARGFTISGPGVVVVDLGTEFGVKLSEAGPGEVHVFRGLVHATWVDDQDEIIASAHVRGGQGFQFNTKEATQESVDSDAARFVHASDLDQMATQPIEVRGTGQGLAVGQADPAWRITAVSNQPGFEPRPAVVCRAHGTYLPSSDASGWLSLKADNGNVDTVSYTFATTFDLTGAAASTAYLDVKMMADNRLLAVRLNGESVQLPMRLRTDEEFRHFDRFTITRGFQRGQNTLEFVIENTDPGTGPNPMAFRAELSGEARVKQNQP